MANYRFDENGNELPPIHKSITEINEYIKSLIEEEALLQDIYAVGEISNFKKHTTGHIYLTLKDENCEIRAIMFRSYAQKLKFNLENGMRVIVHARIGVYPQAGSYQMYIDSMQPDGMGALHLAFEQLKLRLSNEGLFDAEHKRQLPKFPKSIGVITSPTGAAIRDIIKVATSRYPCASIVLYPSLVQGPDAPKELIKGVELFNILNNVDVIIIGRGGGSIEDLWAFNDEMLARSVFSSKIPVISAVGHEIDFTICDFAADVRAATPSHAAELATPNLNEISKNLDIFKRRCIDALQNTILSYKNKLDEFQRSKIFENPLAMYDIPKLKLISLSENLESAFAISIHESKLKFAEINSKLFALNPMSVLARGYGAVFNNDNEVIKSIDDVSVDESLSVNLKDGKFDAVVTNKIRSAK